MLKRMMLFLLCFIPTLLMTQNIEGTVVNDQKEPMAGVAITLLNADSEVLVGTITAKDGTFSLNVAENGEYRVRLIFVGYEEKLIDVEVKGDDVDLKKVVLVKDKEEEVDE